MTTAALTITETAVEPSDAALHNSTQRIHVPIRVGAWDHIHALAPEDRDLLLWWHQHALNQGMTWAVIKEETGFDRTTMFRVLKGSYVARDWSGPLRAIRDYRERWLARQDAARAGTVFVENGPARRVFSVLDYSMASGTIGFVVGESRAGKTMAAREWARRMGEGKAVFVEAPPIGGYRALLGEIARAVGVGNQRKSGPTLLYELRQAFSRGRILIVDEAGHLVPDGGRDRTSRAPGLDCLRHIHDASGCPMVLLVTEKSVRELSDGAYKFEQFIGRTGLVSAIPEFAAADVAPIVAQFGQFSPAVQDALFEVACQPGRLGVVKLILQAAQRIASKEGSALGDAHVKKALAHRSTLSAKVSFTRRARNPKP